MLLGREGGNGRSGTPLLRDTDHNDDHPSSDVDRGRLPGHRSIATTTAPPPRPSMSPPSTGGRSKRRRRRSEDKKRPRSPATARARVRTRYTYAAFFLALSLVAFTVQTELAAWVQSRTGGGWNKPYCMLYLTHGSWTLLWPAQLAVLRARDFATPWSVFWRRHASMVRTTAQMVQTRRLDTAPSPASYPHYRWYLLRTTALITASLTVAGLSWYVAVNMTSPGDLTAIYNCSAFFAYAFSVPLLGERLRLDKGLAVLVAIAGVLVVAYGDTPAPSDGGGGGGEQQQTDAGAESSRRFLGNIIIGIGSVLYGWYEVLYKRLACPPDGCSPVRTVIFSNVVGSLIGCVTLVFLWVPLPLLHAAGIETFVVPSGKTAWYLALSVLANVTFAGSFLVLISLTSPFLTSVASLLTIFIVAIADWFITARPVAPGALLGGALIVVAFAILAWSSDREMVRDGGGGDDDDGGNRTATDSDDDDSDVDGQSDGDLPAV